MKNWIAVLTVIATAALPLSAAAHHSFAMFDNTKTVSLSGTVKEFQWTNPHTWVQLTVPGPGGKAVEWSIEGSSPNGLARRGWKKTALKPGDKVTIRVNPLKNGNPGGSLLDIMFEDGRVLGGGPGAPATGGAAGRPAGGA